MTTHASDTANVFPRMGATRRRKAGQNPLRSRVLGCAATTPPDPRFARGGNLSRRYKCRDQWREETVAEGRLRGDADLRVQFVTAS